MNTIARLAKAPPVPVVAWLAGLAAFAVLGINALAAGPNPVFAIARVTAYVAVAMVAALTAAFVALFALACAAMLAWLGESINTRLIVTAMSRSFWWIAAYVWLGVVLLIVDPPVALTIPEIIQDDAWTTRVGDTTAFAWMGRLRHLALAGFLVMCAGLLARRTKPLNAVLAVAFGATAIAALTAVLGLLTGP